MDDIIQQILPKIVATTILILLWGTICLLFTRYSQKISHIRKKERITKRFKLVLLILFGIIALNIWIPGFFGVFAIMGFVSGAIILTQRDNLLNLMGWVIISWRGIFVEGDLIKVSQHQGKVRRLGFFYFTLYEIDNIYSDNITGNIIKIPNGIVSKQPIINYTAKKNHKYTMSYIYDKNTKIEDLQSNINKIKEYIQNELLKKSFELKIVESINIDAKYFIQQKDQQGIELRLILISPLNLIETIKEITDKYLYELSQKNPNIQLKF